MLNLKYISEIEDVDLYLETLKKHKEHLILIFSIKDTVGLNFRPETASILKDIGIKSELCGQHGHSYYAVINRGELLCEELSKANETLSQNITIDDDIRISIKSSVYSKENLAEIIINDINYAINIRGLNIVVYYHSYNKVIDSVCFDTHVKSNSCYRNNVKINHQLSSIEKDISRLRKNLESITNQLKQIEEARRIDTLKIQMMLWHCMPKEECDDKEIKKHFFRSVPHATGTLRKLQLAGNILLRVFDRICRENGINYWITSGTALGAVRHAGFIPWDDDVDVCVMKEEIEPLKTALKGNNEFYLDEFYSVRSSEPANMNHNYQLHFNVKNTPYSLDIFVCEYSETLDKTTIERTKQLKSEMSNESLRISREMHGLSPVGNKRYDDVYAELAGKYENKAKEIYGDQSSKKFIVWAVDNVPSASGYNHAFRYDTVFPLREIDFEGFKLLAPNNSEDYVSSLYPPDIWAIPDDMLEHQHFAAGMTKERIQILDNLLEKYKNLL